MDKEIKLKLVIDGREANASLSVTEDLISEISKGITDAGVGGRGLGTNLSRSLERARDSIQGLRESIQMVQSFFQTPVRMFIDDEQARMSFKVMIGNAEKATEIFEGLKVLGASTPLEFPGIRSAATTLLQFGVGADDLAGTIRMLGDVSGGNEQRLQSLALVFGQVKANGKLMGQDLLQLINAGFNPLQVMAEKSGKSMGDLRKEMEDGKISFEDMQQAFKDVTSEGGKFFGMMEQQSETLGGKLSTFSDNVTELQIAVGGSIGAAFSPFLAHLSEIVTTFNQLPAPIKNTITLIGTMTAAFVVLRVTGIGAAVKSVMTVGPSLMSTGVIAASTIPPVTGLATAFRAAALSAKNFVASIGPIGWLLIGVTALAEGYMLLKGSSEGATEAAKGETDAIKVQQAEFNSLVKVVQDVNSSSQARKNAISDLNQKYPEYLGKLDLEKASINEIAKAQDEANRQFEKNIALKVADARSQSRYERLAALQDEYAKLQKEFNEAVRLGGTADSGNLFAFTLNEAMNDIQAKIEVTTGEIIKIKNDAAELLVGSGTPKPTIPPGGPAKSKSTEIQKIEEAQKHNLEMMKLNGATEEQLLQQRIQDLHNLYEVYKKNGEDTVKLDNEIASTQIALNNLVSGKKQAQSVKDLEFESLVQKERLNIVGAGQEALLNSEIQFLERKTELLRSQGKDTTDLERETTLKKMQLQGMSEKSEIEYQKQVEDATAATTEEKRQAAKDQEEANFQASSKSLKNIGDLFGKHTAAYKAMSIAQAIIDTYRAAASALAPPPVGAGPLFGGILAATTIAAGMANVAAISATQMPGFAKGGVIVGEAGPEVITPAQDYASGWAQIINATVRATERSLSNGGSSGTAPKEVIVKQRGKDLEGTYRIAKSERERLTW